MTDTWPCPSCGEQVESTGVLTGFGSGPVLAEPNTSHRDCPNCGAPLVRYDNLPEPGWQIDGRTVVVVKSPSQRSGGTTDEHWQAKVWDDGHSTAIDFAVTGTAATAATEENVREAVKRRVANLDRFDDKPRVSQLEDRQVVIDIGELQ